ncbi:MAG: hypothetical protein F4185_08510 [Chloroflexi bacterium]|nr:hypothetical protein [Chloroflexota bacterium]
MTYSRSFGSPDLLFHLPQYVQTDILRRLPSGPPSLSSWRPTRGERFRREQKISSMTDYDGAVIGSGPGGYPAAIRAAQL